MNILIFLIIFGLVLLILWFFIFKVKHLKTPDVFMVDGGVKTGKSLVSVYLAIRQYRRNCFKVAFSNCVIRFLNIFRSKNNKKKLIEKPMLYSNMPLNYVKYNDLTLSIVLREVRIPYKSVCLIDEASLLADSMTGMLTNKEKKERFDYVNENLTLFIKLYGHYTRGGSLFYNSQQIIDLHFAFKRCTSTYLFIQKARKFPFFQLLNVREMVHSEDNDIVNNYHEDIDKSDRPLFIWKKYYKYYDRYYLSALTDDLLVNVDYNVVKYIKNKNMKAQHILTFGDYKSVRAFNERGVLNEKK